MSADNLNQQQARTREEYKKGNHDADHEKRLVNVEKADAVPSPTKRIRIRMIPIWLRLLLLVVFIFVSVVAGAAVGYGVLGGGKMADVFKESTWTHILDLVDKK
ncbi:DNA-directed RNA polymerase subunit beta [Neobacillus sp. MM2021_6]|uniref:DNA-directed RNA polymerase subunit beta n=1 Tax=Bacillaceae TaxID=186817 RepID=UPI00140DF39A|nr:MULTISPECIES: DNA-directed RNA polymerase subunit beta [Bacillaceae]MBO0960992.1 DNA-directed RNA polymerase subunit beta [Neobacillus sp. MM2021_6]NHC19096.1 DNA-directed RNA polymerase subunit beta [Bacillus sp. MM2020_4]